MIEKLTSKKIASLHVNLDRSGRKSEEPHRIDIWVMYDSGAWSAVDKGHPYELRVVVTGEGLSDQFPNEYDHDREDLGVYSKYFSAEQLDKVAKNVNPFGNYFYVIGRLLKMSGATPLPSGKLRLLRDIMGVEVYADENGLEFVAQPDGSLEWAAPREN